MWYSATVCSGYGHRGAAITYNERVANAPTMCNVLCLNWDNIAVQYLWRIVDLLYLTISLHEGELDFVQKQEIEMEKLPASYCAWFSHSW